MSYRSHKYNATSMAYLRTIWDFTLNSVVSSGLYWFYYNWYLRSHKLCFKFAAQKFACIKSVVRCHSTQHFPHCWEHAHPYLRCLVRSRSPEWNTNEIYNNFANSTKVHKSRKFHRKYRRKIWTYSYGKQIWQNHLESNTTCVEENSFC